MSLKVNLEPRFLFCFILSSFSPHIYYSSYSVFSLFVLLLWFLTIRKMFERSSACGNKCIATCSKPHISARNDTPLKFILRLNAL